jgi:hypothetical protein
MPRKPIDYSKACIYKICCKDITIKDVYVGSTTNLHKRRSEHKGCCNRPDREAYNRHVYRFIRDNGGWKDWEVVKIEDCPCECDEDLRRCERHWMETLQATLNCTNPFTGFATREEYCKAYNKEYRQEHKEELLDYQKEYRQEHKEEIASYQKVYNESHKAEIAAKSKARYQKNKVEVIAKTKVYRQDHKEEIQAKASVKVSCEYCQSIVRKSGLSTHQKTKKCRIARGEID